jgi:hypothetical protein
MESSTCIIPCSINVIARYCYWSLLYDFQSKCFVRLEHKTKDHRICYRKPMVLCV